jgi:hypothetical protein
MTMKNILAATALTLTFAASANAATVKLSDFFQDWTLDAYSSTGKCLTKISAIPSDEVPGTNGMPQASNDTETSIRFKYAGADDQVLTLGNEDGTKVTLNGNKLNVTQKKSFLFFSRTTSNETFTLNQDGSLIITNGSQSNCTYNNDHPELFGKIEVGASLSINGVKVSECKFAPASPRPDQVNFVYSEACDLGAFADKTILDDSGIKIGEELAASALVPHDVVIVRSDDKINGGSQNWVSLDAEIYVQPSPGSTLTPVDEFYPHLTPTAFIPYENTNFSIYGTNGVVQIEYASQ